MARPRRATAEAFYDVFADFPLEEQAAALKIMEQIHRLAKRDAGRKMIAAANAEVQIEIRTPSSAALRETASALDLDLVTDDTRPAISGGVEDQDR